MTRDQLLKTFNERFYFLLQADDNGLQVFEANGGDVYEAMAKYLRFLALEDDHHKRADTVKMAVSVSLTPDGPWQIVTIAPAWRQCEPVVQNIIERVLLTKHEWATQYLMDMDTQQFSEVLAQVE